MNDYRILVVDDEEDLCEILKFNLENEGYEVDTANSAEEAMKMDISSYHLILLDVMMGEISGFKMANILKKDKKTAKVPIIFITAKDTENDTVTGFNLGADDYIVKPFDPMELVARVKSHLLRYERLTGKNGTTQEGKEYDADDYCIEVGGLKILTKSWKVIRGGEEIHFPNREFELLKYLAMNPNIVFSKEHLFERIWGYDYMSDSATVTVHINRIREKIEEDPKNPKIIETVWGAGYRLNIR